VQAEWKERLNLQSRATPEQHPRTDDRGWDCFDCWKTREGTSGKFVGEEQFMAQISTARAPKMPASGAFSPFITLGLTAVSSLPRENVSQSGKRAGAKV
jgi:hypothetical protein